MGKESSTGKELFFSSGPEGCYYLVSKCRKKTIDIPTTRSPSGGDGSDIEDQDDDNLVDSATMPQEIAREVVVFYDEPAADTSKTSRRQRGELPR